MRREEIIEVQLRQAEQALETTRRMKELAEQQYRQVLSLLHRIILSLLAPEWNELRREHPDAEKWPPEQLVAWIIDSVKARINRLEILSGGHQSCENQQLQERIQQLQERIRQLEEEVGQLRSANEEARQLQEENRRLRAEIQALQRTSFAVPEVPCGADPDLEQWIRSASGGAIELLRVIGSTGLSLREDIARATGRLSARYGGVVDLFQELITAGMVVEESLPAEGKGKSPNVVRLGPRGKEAYLLLTGRAPVESEFDRLLRRHRSAEQALLALRARQVLEEFGATEVDLFPESIPIGDGRVFQVDVTAVLEGRRIFVECERTSTRNPRLDKWSLYRAVTTEFYFFVPNKTVLGQLVTELNLWAFRRIDEAQGVTVHIHQVSARDKDDKGERKLWHYVRPLAGTAK